MKLRGRVLLVAVVVSQMAMPDEWIGIGELEPLPAGAIQPRCWLGTMAQRRRQDTRAIWSRSMRGSHIRSPFTDRRIVSVNPLFLFDLFCIGMIIEPFRYFIQTLYFRCAPVCINGMKAD